MTLSQMRAEISAFLKFDPLDSPVPFATEDAVSEEGYRRLRIRYKAEDGDEVPAFLLLPDGSGLYGAVLVHHQHHGQRQLGKSEVSGLAGDPLQAFGPALARQGMVVLAPDSICFEDRRKNRSGTEADEEDVAQHYNEMCYRLLKGDTLMRKVLSDSARGISLLRSHPLVDPGRVGILGHSYGGNTVLFHGALDERIRFACSSGAACSYEYKLANDIGIEMAEVIPGFAKRFDIPDLVACFAPRPILILSAMEDPHSKDAEQIVTTVREKYPISHIEHKRYEGGHALTRQRFDEIVHWLVQAVTIDPP